MEEAMKKLSLISLVLVSFVFTIKVFGGTIDSPPKPISDSHYYNDHSVTVPFTLKEGDISPGIIDPANPITVGQKTMLERNHTKGTKPFYQRQYNVNTNDSPSLHVIPPSRGPAISRNELLSDGEYPQIAKATNGDLYVCLNTYDYDYSSYLMIHLYISYDDGDSWYYGGGIYNTSSDMLLPDIEVLEDRFVIIYIEDEDNDGYHDLEYFWAVFDFSEYDFGFIDIDVAEYVNPWQMSITSDKFYYDAESTWLYVTFGLNVWNGEEWISNLYYTASADFGGSWSFPTQVTEDNNLAAFRPGIAIAFGTPDPGTGQDYVYTTWRDSLYNGYCGRIDVWTEEVSTNIVLPSSEGEYGWGHWAPSVTAYYGDVFVMSWVEWGEQSGYNENSDISETFSSDNGETWGADYSWYYFIDNEDLIEAYPAPDIGENGRRGFAWHKGGGPTVEEYLLYYHDDYYESQIGCGGGCWLGTKMTPPNYPATLVGTYMAFMGDANTTAGNLQVYVDPSGSGDPYNNAVLVWESDFFAAPVGEYYIDIPDIEITSGDFYLMHNEQNSGFSGIALDESGGYPDRMFYATVDGWFPIADAGFPYNYYQYAYMVGVPSLIQGPALAERSSSNIRMATPQQYEQLLSAVDVSIKDEMQIEEVDTDHNPAYVLESMDEYFTDPETWASSYSRTTRSGEILFRWQEAGLDWIDSWSDAVVIASDVSEGYMVGSAMVGSNYHIIYDKGAEFQVYHHAAELGAAESPDLTDGSNCSGWQTAIVFNDAAGDFMTDGLDEPLPEGTYYLNSVIQNIGTADAVFQDNESMWKIYLDGEEIQSWGYWTGFRKDAMDESMFDLTEQPTFSGQDVSSRDDYELIIHMYDEYGDGWNGNVLTIAGYEFTLDNGDYGNEIITLSDGVYDVICDGGSWQSEVSWEIADYSSGEVLLAGGAPYSGELVLGGSSGEHIIAPGECLPGLSSYWNDPGVDLTEGTHILMMVIDADGFISESNENNNVYQRTIEVEPSQSLTLLTPTSGSSYQIGSTMSITWESEGAGNSIEIEASSNGGSSWEIIVESTSNDGNYSWSIPADWVDVSSGVIRITAVEYPFLTSTSGTFSVTPTSQPQLVSVSDTPNDDGYFVDIVFSRSSYDYGAGGAEIYTVWRLMDNGNWQSTNSQDASGQSLNYAMGTTFTVGEPTTFQITATMDEGTYTSATFMGTSIDNIPPAVPTGVFASSMGGDIVISWDANIENDFAYYQVFRGTSADTNMMQLHYETIENSYSEIYNASYFYSIKAVDHSSNESGFSQVVDAGALSVNDQYEIPDAFVLNVAYPNPFNPSTSISYDLPEKVHVSIMIHDMLGRQVRTLINQTQDAGFKSVIWNATNDYGEPVSAGVYLYQIQAGEFVQTRKMVLLK
tara:strand:+ start:719 stop:4891 length:4173 start_codon:yes stop_codon:yes gene_type:complete